MKLSQQNSILRRLGLTKDELKRLRFLSANIQASEYIRSSVRILTPDEQSKLAAVYLEAETILKNHGIPQDTGVDTPNPNFEFVFKGIRINVKESNWGIYL